MRVFNYDKRSEKVDCMKLKKKRKIKKEKLVKISTYLGILTVILSGMVILYQYLDYLYHIQWFDYWNIDTVFYQKSQNDILNSFINCLFILCYLIYFSILFYNISIRKNNKSDKGLFLSTIESYIVYGIFFIMLNLKNLYQYNFTVNKIFLNIFWSVITACILTLVSKKVVKFYIDIRKNNFKIIDVLLFFLVCMVSFLFTATFLGNCNAWLRKDYLVSYSDQSNICEVALYSNKDYYIVTDCKIINNNLTIYRNHIRKIDSDNVSFQLSTFDRIIRS